MERLRVYSHRKAKLIGGTFIVVLLALGLRVGYLMIFRASHYAELAVEVEQRERKVKAARGRIIDRNGVILASNKTVCTISVIHNQIEDPEAVISCLTKELGLTEEEIRKKVEKVSSIEKIKTNVEKDIGDAIRAYDLAGVKVDDDYKRYYPYDRILSKVFGFTGGDNQGIIGLEAYYDEALQGEDGKILTYTDARGVEVAELGEVRLEPEAGDDLYVSLDYNISRFATQLAEQTMQRHQASGVEIIVMNPKNGEIYTMVNVPEFSLQEPFTLTEYMAGQTGEKTDLLNEMWRNICISDTYEPGSTFKIITTAAALEEGVVTPEESFYCNGSITVEDTRIRCHKTTAKLIPTFPINFVMSWAS